MVDVGAILRSIVKSNDYELPEVSNYLKRYREFSGTYLNPMIAVGGRLKDHF